MAIHGKISLNNGPKKEDLEKALFGSQAGDEEPHYPALPFYVVKPAYIFGWINGKIRLKISSVERLSPQKWFIKANIEGQCDRFTFEGEYDSHLRIGGGKIIYASSVNMNINLPLDQIESYLTGTIENKLSVIKSHKRDYAYYNDYLLDGAFMLWVYCDHNVENYLIASDAIEYLNNFTGDDERIQYLLGQLVGKFRKK